MAGHSRSKNGVASLAYVPAIHVFELATRLRRGTRPIMLCYVVPAQAGTQTPQQLGSITRG